MDKKYMKPSLILRVLLLYKFDIVSKDRKRTKSSGRPLNISCERGNTELIDEFDIDDTFLDEWVLATS